MFCVLRNLLAVPLKRRAARSRPGLAIESLEERQVLASADLTMASEVLIQVGYAADSIYISASADVENQGPVGLTADNVLYRAVLSVDQEFGNGDDMEYVADLLDLNLPTGGAVNVPLVGFVDQDHYEAANFLLIKIDPDGTISEENYENNVGVIALPGMPKLTTTAGETAGKTNKFVRIDPGITLTDDPLEDYNGCELRVSILDDATDNNIVSIKRTRTESGVLRRKGDDLLLGKRVVGTIAGGTNAQTFVITFNGSLNVSEMENVASAVAVKGKKDVPGVRRVFFHIVKSDVVTGLSVFKDVALS